MSNATLPPEDASGNPYIDYVESFGHEADLPLEWVVAEVSKMWGPNKRQWLERGSAWPRASTSH